MEDETYKEELLRLVTEKKLNILQNIYRERNGRSVKKIYEDYQRRELDEVNEKVTDVLITKLSELMVNLDLVKDNVSLEDDLAKNELS